MSKSLISERAFEFSRRVLRLCDQLSRQGLAGRHIATELTGCATSIGANVEEAQDAQSKRDFIAKLSIARKEARETLYWLRLAKASGISKDGDLAWEIDEANPQRGSQQQP